MRASWLGTWLGLALLACVSHAKAASFDPQGNFIFDPTAIATEGYEVAVPSPALAVEDASALEGQQFARLSANSQLRVELPLEATDTSARLRIFMRGQLGAVYYVGVFGGPGNFFDIGVLSPTGTMTSDGWYEVQSAPISIPMSRANAKAYFTVVNLGAGALDLDGMEVVPEGTFKAGQACAGQNDCDAGERCMYGYCGAIDMNAPLMPQGQEHDQLVEYLRSQVHQQFGGIDTRKAGLPAADAAFDQMKASTTAGEYWTAMQRAFQLLHDSHTGASVGIGPLYVLPICAVEADADLSHSQAPADPMHRDVVISHALASNGANLKAGDRIVEVDGKHPVEFVRGLVGVMHGSIFASDDAVEAKMVEILPTTIRAFAHDITVVRCDAQTSKCGQPETIAIGDLPFVHVSDAPICDHRIGYHLASGNPDAVTHNLDNEVFHGLLADSQPGENLYGMIFDSLAPTAGDPYAPAIQEFVDNASGVVIDHRTGNGGSFLYASEISASLMPTEIMTVTPGPEAYLYKAPSWTQADGLATYERWEALNPFTVGSASPKPGLQAAVLVARDVSASDFFALGLRGHANVKSFGTRSDGAFSSIRMFSHGGYLPLNFSIGVADSFAPDGTAMCGHGADPDVIVVPKQSDILAGRDTSYELALQWLRTGSIAKGGKE